MTQLDHFFRFHWKEIVVVNIFPQCVIAAIYSFKLSVVLSTVFVGLALVALVFGFARILTRQELPLRGDAVAFQVPRRGMIFTVGLTPKTIHMALKHRKPDYLAFICSSKSELLADELADEFRYDEEHVKKEIVDPQNIKEIRTKTNLILDWLAEKGLEMDEIAVDITGGMTTMSVAVFSVTEDRNVDSQYIRSQYDEEKNCYIDGTQEAVFVSRYSKG
jgi:hypothetical protein